MNGTGGGAGGSCTAAQYATVEAAVGAATAGDTIEVCSGTYTENVTVDKNLTIVGDGNPTITASTDTDPTIDITGAGVTASISGLTITGGHFGILSEPGTTASISGNTVSGFTKTGISVGSYDTGGDGASATVSGNTVTGTGPNGTVAENGIEVAFGAAATVSGNTVKNLLYTGTDTQATGILVFNSSNTAVTNNTITDVQAGVVFDAGAYGTDYANWSMQGDSASGNTVSYTSGYTGSASPGTFGIFAAAYGDGGTNLHAGSLDVTISANTLDGDNSNTPSAAIKLGDGDPAGTLTVALQCNAVTGAWTTNLDQPADSGIVNVTDTGCPPSGGGGSGTVTTTVPAGGTASSSGSAPSSATPVVASVTSPNGGTVTFTPSGTGTAEPGYTMLGHSFVITAPSATASDPLQLSFKIDDASLPAGADPSLLTVFRDGTAIPACATPNATTADPDPCVSSSTTAGGVTTLTVLSSHASTWAFAVKVNTCATSPFPDVAASSQFCGDIAWLKAQAITTGYTDGTFGPTRSISRQAMAAFLYRMQNPGKADPTCTSAPFTDVAVASTFCGDITWLKAQAISTGYTDGTFGPARAVSRQAMAAFLHRLSS
ncbi:MAG TPA: S-layer homology domain-containing protein [Jatrophihabitantaceae bacterium]|nr:S-layer homology domain-containing protein [Jatrophihabitantaceae bacterium]